MASTVLGRKPCAKNLRHTCPQKWQSATKLSKSQACSLMAATCLSCLQVCYGTRWVGSCSVACAGLHSLVIEMEQHDRKTAAVALDSAKMRERQVRSCCAGRDASCTGAVRALAWAWASFQGQADVSIVASGAASVVDEDKSSVVVAADTAQGKFVGSREKTPLYQSESEAANHMAAAAAASALDHAHREPAARSATTGLTAHAPEMALRPAPELVDISKREAEHWACATLVFSDCDWRSPLAARVARTGQEPERHSPAGDNYLLQHQW